MRSQPAQKIDWPEHISQWRASKLTRTEYCRQHSLKFQTFVYKVKRHRQGPSIPLTLVPVKVQTALAAPDLILRGPKGWCLTLGAGVSADWLAELLRQL
jgi:hypothetical protein